MGRYVWYMDEKGERERKSFSGTIKAEAANQMTGRIVEVKLAIDSLTTHISGVLINHNYTWKEAYYETNKSNKNVEAFSTIRRKVCKTTTRKLGISLL